MYEHMYRQLKNSQARQKAPNRAQRVCELLKIMLAMIVWLAMTDANHALTAAVDYSKLRAVAGMLIQVPALHFSYYLPAIALSALAGLKIGFLQGALVSIKALIFLWIGPSMFKALGPVMSAALKIPTRIVADLRRAWSAGSGTQKPDEPKS